MARITVDYTAAIWQSAGIGRLTRELVQALLALDDVYITTISEAIQVGE